MSQNTAQYNFLNCAETVECTLSCKWFNCNLETGEKLAHLRGAELGELNQTFMQKGDFYRLTSGLEGMTWNHAVI